MPALLEGVIEALKVSVKDGKPCEKVLKIEVEGEVVRKEYEAFYNAVAPQSRIPGFRPGKAPRDVIAMHYRDEAKSSVLKQLVTDSIRQALQEKSIQPIGMPEIDEVKFEENVLSYQARVEVRPKIKLSRVTGLKVKRQKFEVKPEEVEESLKRVQESFAKFKAVEDRAAVMGDYLIADFRCEAEGKEIEKRNDDWIELREEEALKGFSAALVGVKPGEEKDFSLTLPAEFGRKEFAGKQALFHIRVKEIKMKELPALNDELAKEAGECQTLEELRGKIRQEMARHKERESETQFEKAVLDELIKHNKIELPPRLVEKRLERLVQGTLNRYRQHFPEEKKAELEAKFRQELAPEAGRQVHVAFVLDEIAARENLLVSDEDLKNRFQLIAADLRQPAEKVEAYYRQDEDTLEALREQIRSEKAIDFVKRNAKE